MVTDFFGSLIEELGQVLQLPLKPDTNQSCLIKFKEGIQVQLEMDKLSDSLIIGTDFGIIPPGPYRENLFTTALKANNMPYPRYGIFAYSRHADHFILFDKLSARELSGVKLGEFLIFFNTKAIKWKQAISRGDVPELEETGSKQQSGMFGLR